MSSLGADTTGHLVRAPVRGFCASSPAKPLTRPAICGEGACVGESSRGLRQRFPCVGVLTQPAIVRRQAACRVRRSRILAVGRMGSHRFPLAGPHAAKGTHTLQRGDRRSRK